MPVFFTNLQLQKFDDSSGVFFVFAGMFYAAAVFILMDFNEAATNKPVGFYTRCQSGWGVTKLGYGLAAMSMVGVLATAAYNLYHGEGDVPSCSPSISSGTNKVKSDLQPQRKVMSRRERSQYGKVDVEDENDDLADPSLNLSAMVEQPPL
jgi:hypothetical protein